MSPYTEDYFKDYKEQPFKWKFWAQFIKKKFPKESAILEIGCTYGFLFKYLKDFPNKYGIDISEHAIKQAKILNHGAYYEAMDTEKLTFKDSSFSVIIAIDTMEHIKNPERACKEIARVLKKDGAFIMVTPNLNALSRKRKRKDWFAYQDPTHTSLLTKEQWLSLLEKNSLRITKIRSIDMFDRSPKKIAAIANLLSYILNIPYAKSLKRDNLLLIAKKC